MECCKQARVEETRMKSNKGVLPGFVIVVLALCGAATTTSMAAPGGPSMKADQVNNAPWDKAWTNLVNDVQQSFKPSLPKLLAVEVDLVVGNPGPPEDELTLTVLDSAGQAVAVVTQTVQASDCDHTIFVISKDGVDVQPGQTYRLKLTGGTLFGWKYVVGGYKEGAATFNGKPLLPKAHSTFLFKTFGAESPTAHAALTPRPSAARNSLAAQQLPPPPNHSPNPSIPCWA
jgi:hypothetical protein